MDDDAGPHDDGKDHDPHPLVADDDDDDDGADDALVVDDAADARPAHHRRPHHDHSKRAGPMDGMEWVEHVLQGLRRLRHLQAHPLLHQRLLLVRLPL